MRIYLDSNIYRKAKRSSGQFSQPVYNTLEKMKDSFIFFFSEAHLFDLANSLEDYRNDDLVQMEHYVRNNYVQRDHIYKKFHYYLATPTEAYQNMDFETHKKVLENPYAYISNIIDNSEVLKPIKALFDIPLLNQGVAELAPPNQFSVFKNAKTINDVFKGMLGIGSILSDKKAYKKYRKLIDGFVNRDDYSFEKWSFDFDERMKSTVYNKTFTEMVNMLTPAEKSDDYDRFINTYNYLEHLKVTEEKTGRRQTRKKNSYWDIHKDAMHAYYASFTDYFVTDDIGLQTKAFITYKLLNKHTEVLSVNDFINRSTLLMLNEDTLESFLDGVAFTIDNGLIVRQHNTTNANVIKPLYPIFNYFNRIQIDADDNGKLLYLFKTGIANHGYTYAEIELLIRKCKRLFGEDINYRQETGLDEFSKYEANEPIRIWHLGNHSIVLSLEDNTIQQRIIALTIRFNQHYPFA